MLKTLLSASLLATQAMAFQIFDKVHPVQSDTSVFHHNSLPGHQIRAHKTNGSICSGNEGIAGYLDIDEGDKHFFFWAFESRNDPTKDPVILWMSGGPGCSGVGVGMLAELGPCMIAEDGTLSNNPHAWNNNATVIFIDQPMGVGFSYSNEPVQSLEVASTDTLHFLQLFFHAFPQLAVLDFYIAGESYGGSWVPDLAAHILDYQQSNMGQIAMAARVDLPIINLKGITLGNAAVADVYQWKGFYETGCLGEDPLFNQTVCQKMLTGLPRCETLLQTCRSTGYDMEVCGPILEFCRDHSTWVLSQVYPNRNPYNFRVECQDTKDGLCYKSLEYASDYLNDLDVQKELGVDLGFKFQQCSPQIGMDFASSGDTNRPLDKAVTYLLDSGISVLVYVGTLDWYCNAAGMRYLVDELPWSGNVAFRATSLNSWGMTLDDGSKRFVTIGNGKRSGRLTYLEVENSGHMVPLDRGPEAVAMINGWITDNLEWVR